MNVNGVLIVCKTNVKYCNKKGGNAALQKTEGRP